MTTKEASCKRAESRTIHIAVIDAAPLYTFQHDELHLAQPVSRSVAALVGLLRILRVAKLSASPRPAPRTPEKAHVLRRKRRKRPRPPSPPNDPQKCARVQDQTHNQRRQASRRRAEHRREHVRFFHMERLAALRWRRRREGCVHTSCLTYQGRCSNVHTCSVTSVTV